MENNKKLSLKSGKNYKKKKIEFILLVNLLNQIAILYYGSSST